MQFYLVYFFLSLFFPFCVIIEDLKVSCVYTDVDKQEKSTYKDKHVFIVSKLCNQRRIQIAIAVQTHTHSEFEGETDLKKLIFLVLTLRDKQR